ncbi:unnamed protein product [Lymnaea stagnalis]|uniref:HD domain-containing protein n=1 Tax=Lymnaea stagnalis TaxID=6523 RepID=A0AAV2ICE6_LYMST
MDKSKSEINKKVYSDPVHGNIHIHPACQLIIDTPEFQRLRYLKQMGMASHVYPGAVHTRFEHSLGVCHLAGEFARMLRQKQPLLDITYKDILCVEIAGLCHDLGHGPLSHTFDAQVMAQLSPEANFTHEHASIKMFTHLLEEHQLLHPDGPLTKYELNSDDITFIKEMIYTEKNQKRTGRPEHKAFLYEIVSNKETGVDVDKFDYFARDCHHLGTKNNFHHRRFMMFTRVIYDDSDKKWHICVRDKELLNLYHMYFTRYSLQKFVWYHRVNQSIELMATHALIKASSRLKVDGRCLLKDCINDMKAFSKLNDEILYRIRHSEDRSEDMEEAKAIIERILSRDFYICVYESEPIKQTHLPNEFNDKKEHEIEPIIKQKIMDLCHVSDSLFTVKMSTFDFGRKTDDPLKNMKVFNKKEPNKARKPEEGAASRILVPTNCSEAIIRVFIYKKDPEIETKLRDAALKWKEAQIKDYPEEARGTKIDRLIDDFNRSHPSENEWKRLKQDIMQV